MTNETGQNFDVIIVGGGPAGVSAAMGFLEARLSCLLIDRMPDLGGQLPDIPSPIVNLPATTFKDGASAAQALRQALESARIMARDSEEEKLRSELGLRSNNASLLTVLNQCSVTSIATDHEAVRIGTTNKNGQSLYTARYLLVATGYRVRHLPIPGSSPRNELLERHWHNHTDTLPADLRETNLAVVGGGDSAVLKAAALAAKANTVHLICRGRSLRCRPDLLASVEKIGNCRIHTLTQIVGVRGDKALTQVLLQREQDQPFTLDISEVIVKVGYEPNTEILDGIVKLTTTKHVVVADGLVTSEPRIYAAGDITNEAHPRIVSAMGQGMLAAGQICEKIFAEMRS
ncbi:MAG: NAD(P)/FAD-dependent oxidoreductase [Cyanobacteria bacterium SZAS LIN-2]|nr:NAD(P)/FAD-dependent oxidoreductase [Cyanobacteria bacterium SZAS LIN-2]